MKNYGKIGDIVTFRYYGGSDYGGFSRIKVTQETSNTLSGIEVDSKGENVGGYKKYMKAKINCFSIVTPFEIAKTELETFLRNNGEYAPVMVREFNKKWNVNYTYIDNKLIETPKPSTIEIKVPMVKNGLTGEITGVFLGVRFSISKTGYLFVDGHCTSYISQLNRKLLLNQS